MRVEVDITDALDASAEARRELRTVPAVMHRIGSDAAKASRNNHIYQNRTGAAEANTKAYSEHTSDAAYTLVTINVPYGSYLMKGGTTRRHESLTALEDAIDVATNELDFFMDGLGSGLDP